MSRPWRIEFEGALYHVLSRRNERRDIFIDDEDRNSFINLMGDMSDRFEVDIFAYVLMNNHYHTKVLGCNLEAFRESLRISEADKSARDLMVYILWQTGRFTNRDVAKLFGLSYSSVSSRVSIVRNRLREDKVFKDKFDRTNVLIKM